MQEKRKKLKISRKISGLFGSCVPGPPLKTRKAHRIPQRRSTKNTKRNQIHEVLLKFPIHFSCLFAHSVNFVSAPVQSFFLSSVFLRTSSVLSGKISDLEQYPLSGRTDSQDHSKFLSFSGVFQDPQKNTVSLLRRIRKFAILHTGSEILDFFTILKRIK